MRILYVTLLVLGFTSGILMETCPSEEDISPCTCQDDKSGDIEVQCTGTIDLEILKGALSSLSGKNVAELYLEKLKLGKLASNFFYGIRIKRLEFHDCGLNNLTNDDQPGLVGLENYLEKLAISGSFIDRNVRTKLNFGHLKKLKELDLSENVITYIDNDWFSNGPSSLEILIIRGFSLKKIGSNAFSQLSNLKELRLQGNNYGPITRSILPSTAGKLERLDLNWANLTNIPEDIFSKMPSIARISLKSSGITTLDERTWSPIWQQLDELTLFGNSMRCDGRLNWIISSKKRPRILGNCSTPSKFKGLTLETFLKSRNW